MVVVIVVIVVVIVVIVVVSQRMVSMQQDMNADFGTWQSLGPNQNHMGNVILPL